jgi:hypothetical protein
VGEFTEFSGAWVLGHNQLQSGSEMQAGARAQLLPSPVTQALSTIRGRIASRTVAMLFYGRMMGIMNYVALRPFAMMDAVRTALADCPEPHPLVIDPAAGYSSQLIWQAEEMPDLQCLEIDLPAIIQDKRIRLQSIDLPPNFTMLEADLSQVRLHEVLGEQRASVIMVPGSYVNHDDYRDLLGYLRHVLTPTGKVISTFADARGVENLRANSALFARFGGNISGFVHEDQDIYRIFEQANYQILNIMKLSEIAVKLRKPLPADIEILVISQPR